MAIEGPLEELGIQDVLQLLELARKTGVSLSKETRITVLTALKNFYDEQVFALLVKVVFIALTPLGLTSLWLAVAADMGASLLVIFNGLRAAHVEVHAALHTEALLAVLACFDAGWRCDCLCG